METALPRRHGVTPGARGDSTSKSWFGCEEGQAVDELRATGESADVVLRLTQRQVSPDAIEQFLNSPERPGRSWEQKSGRIHHVSEHVSVTRVVLFGKLRREHDDLFFLDIGCRNITCLPRRVRLAPMHDEHNPCVRPYGRRAATPDDDWMVRAGIDEPELAAGLVP
jgi:hypothetical protein